MNRIKVEHGGPLPTDFDFQPADLNLIFGPNESGKTYIVEALVTMLFKGAKSAWKTRDWPLNGKIFLDGLGAAPIAFTKTGRKLEDYWQQKGSFPPVLSRLLVVKGGETELDREKPDGVGPTMLKSCLSGEGLLDSVEKGISATLQNAKVEHRSIHGKDQGELARRNERRRALDKVNQLLSDIEQSTALAKLSDEKRHIAELDAKIRNQNMAKRACAGKLATELRALESKKSNLPSEDDERSLERVGGDYERDLETREGKIGQLSDASTAGNDLAFVESAAGHYEELLRGEEVHSRDRVLAALGLLSLVGLAAVGFIPHASAGRAVALGVLAAGACVFYALLYRSVRKRAPAPAAASELEQLKRAFGERFGQELSCLAALKAKASDLSERAAGKGVLIGDVQQLDARLRDGKLWIEREIRGLTGADGDVDVAAWEGVLNRLRENRRDMEDQIRGKDRALRRLGVPEEEYDYDDHVDSSWDSSELTRLGHDKDEAAFEAGKLEEELRGLRSRARQEAGDESTSWEDLISQLRSRQSQLAGEYRTLTAEALAKVALSDTLKGLRQEENARIDKGLSAPELAATLHALTGHYRGIKLGPQGTLVVTSDDGEEYPLEDLSAGTREQVHFALRTGFASTSMGGQPSFLILDDAFQHSDWERRKRLVALATQLAADGWQILYFSMDDQIKSLFLEIQQQRPRVKLVELAGKPASSSDQSTSQASLDLT